jgi:hypothetical protein
MVLRVPSVRLTTWGHTTASAAVFPASMSLAARTVPRNKSAGTAAGAAFSASKEPARPAERLIPRRLKRSCSNRLARSSRPASVLLGQPSSAAACS